MAKKGSQQGNLSILEEIYHEDTSPKTTKEVLRDYFSNPKKVELLLSWAIVFFGLMAVFVGVFQVKSNIVRDFLVKNDQANQTENQYDANDLLGLKNKDTDQDGISDYDELNVYQTSPYLPDTDSDGIKDKTEITQGTDPTCNGTNCFATPSDLKGATSTTETSLTAVNEDSNTSLKKEILVGQLRSALKQSGVTDEELSALTDDEILAEYYSLAQEMEGTENTDETTDFSSVTELQNLTPDEVRALLANQGVSQDIINNISDEDLMKLVNETLASQN